MGGARGRAALGVLAALGVCDVAYRLFVREPLRRSLGMERRNAVSTTLNIRS